MLGWRFKHTGVILAVLIVFMGFGSALAADPIKIGVVTPVTGANADVGSHVVNGATLAVREINARGGIIPAGESEPRLIELVVADDQARPDIGINAITKLIDSDRVFGFLGPDFSGVTAPSSYLSEEAGVLQLTSSLSAAITRTGNPWLFRLRPTDQVYAERVVEYAVDALGAQKIALSYTNNELGLSGIGEVEQYLKSAYGRTPAVKVSHGAGDRDLSSAASAIIRSGADVVVNWGLQTEAALLIRDLRNLGWDGEFLYQTADPIFVELAREFAEGVVGPQNWFHSALDDQSRIFTENYVNAFGRLPTSHSAVYYDGVQLLAAGIEAVGFNRDNVRQWLSGLTGHRGISGVYQTANIGKTGDMSLAVLMGEITDGEPAEAARYGY